MEICTLWIKRKGFEGESPELLEAWDEYSVDLNFDGWRKACDDALAAVGDDVAAVRFASVSVGSDQVEKLFEMGKVQGVALQQIDDPRSI